MSVRDVNARGKGPRCNCMSLNGPLLTQPPPDPRGIVTFPPERACSPGLYSPSPERDVSLPSKRGLAARSSAHNGQSQYLASTKSTLARDNLCLEYALTVGIRYNHILLEERSPRAR